MDKKTSPLKAKPLRHPGQSVQEEIDKIIDEKIGSYLMMIAMMLFLTFYHWYIWDKDYIPNPIGVSLITIPIIIYCLFKAIIAHKNLKNLKLGRDGEKAVGQFLELLREDGCIVFHDIVGDNFNLDHVVISEKGIYCIETKTYSKPNAQKPKIKYEDGKLNIDGLGDKSEILDQVKAASGWLKSTLKESTGKDFDVKPVILFPGWWTESDKKDIWVLEPKGFPKFLNNQANQIPTDIKKMVGLHLSRYIRAL